MTDMQYSDVVAKLQDDTETEIDIRYTPTNSYITSCMNFYCVVSNLIGLQGISKVGKLIVSDKKTSNT